MENCHRRGRRWKNMDSLQKQKKKRPALSLAPRHHLATRGLLAPSPRLFCLQNGTAAGGPWRFRGRVVAGVPGQPSPLELRAKPGAQSRSRAARAHPTVAGDAVAARGEGSQSGKIPCGVASPAAPAACPSVRLLWARCLERSGGLKEVSAQPAPPPPPHTLPSRGLGQRAGASGAEP